MMGTHGTSGADARSPSDALYAASPTIWTTRSTASRSTRSARYSSKVRPPTSSTTSRAWTSMSQSSAASRESGGIQHAPGRQDLVPAIRVDNQAPLDKIDPPLEHRFEFRLHREPGVQVPPHTG